MKGGWHAFVLPRKGQLRVMLEQCDVNGLNGYRSRYIYDGAYK